MDILASVAAAGTAAVITVTAIHPIDVVKTRLQVSGDTPGARNYKSLGSLGTVRVIAGEEGITAFWKGIGAAWMREASYTSLRIGLYGPIKSAMGVTNDSHFVLKFSAGSLAGALGSVVGNPFDVLKTRMMATEGKEPPALFKTAGDLYKNQGMGGFYRGIEANIMRAMVLNGTKMGVYDTIKGMIKKWGAIPAGIPTDFCSAFGAGFFMAVTVTPFDMVRTQLMNQPHTQPRMYSGFVDCVVKVVKNKGPQGLYAGFFPIW
eukprot:CAMPEP_0185017632 /NCGR_PEP_ID=MMETSP1103-20130426/557_1 /TAXON_ID=36769 /ORGANISM="Paraphysomonas bandaiensis, Strain Caron Lab Isolate" /LENGTH=261 /DNA_ID=CAMNT_0027547131 /DNA_START=37 /DNA_END=819 /DNA_ORIENTATION=+